MPCYIVKLHDDKLDRDWYLEWSTIVDAPVTNGMSLEEFREYYREEYGANGMSRLNERLARVEAKGTSSQLGNSVDELIDIFNLNHAGRDGAYYGREEILEHYCRNPDEE